MPSKAPAFARATKKFPQAHRYVAQLRAKLAAHPRIDATNMFLTGFSFGGGTVLKHLDARYIGDVPGWRAVAAAEPGCGMFSEPVAISFPVLIIKGGESHYPPALALYRDLLRAAGTRVSYLLIPTANHFFSENGRIVEVAVNGCSDNPVIRAPNGKLRFADGTPTDRATVMRKCITNRAGAGRSREHLDFAIQKIIDFFQAARRAGARRDARVSLPGGADHVYLGPITAGEAPMTIDIPVIDLTRFAPAPPPARHPSRGRSPRPGKRLAFWSLKAMASIPPRAPICTPAPWPFRSADGRKTGRAATAQ